jgi:hypothetical protein
LGENCDLHGTRAHGVLVIVGKIEERKRCLVLSFFLHVLFVFVTIPSLILLNVG